jgi:hypothetical protein
MNDLTSSPRLYMDIWKDARGVSLYVYREGAALDDYEEARLSRKIWDAVSSITLDNAAVDLKLLLNSVIEHDVEPLTLAVCEHASSLMKLARIIQGLSLPSARRMAHAWMRLPLHCRSSGSFIYDDEKVVQTQLMGLVGRSSPVAATTMPQDFCLLIETMHWAGLTPIAGPYWACARSPLGSTAVAFDNRSRGNLHASVAISDGPVSFRSATREHAQRAEAAIEFLIWALPQVINDREALALSQWVPSGHGVLELSGYLENLRSQVGVRVRQ